ncbi:bifunctional diguanylate cyclase/phosphodiesterase [Cognatishimia sp. WU-CL00825]|uniref:putative bifunctional diguanylate cyclase/phosphodiesterase n=1 Tax=Cognatishimia sp. WU-CL00825 TaxID=3127658 RepID=UPI00310B80D2
MKQPYKTGQSLGHSVLNWATHPTLIGLGISLSCLVAYWAGGEQSLLFAAIFLLLLGFHFVARYLPKQAENPNIDRLTGLQSISYVRDVAQNWLKQFEVSQRKTACFVLSIDSFDDVVTQYGEAAAQQIQQTVAARISRGLRDEDLFARSGDGDFLLLLTPVRHLDLEICVQLATRLKSAIETAIPVEATTVDVTAGIGFCRSDQILSRYFSDLEDATRMALREARKNGASSMRAYSEKMRRRNESHKQLCQDAARALQLGEIRAWFQPQISTDTGKITGFESLARWEHPQKGIVAPGEFLDTLAETGQLEKLADFMLKSALQAQSQWQSQGFEVPHVGVNFSGDELRNPNLVDKIHWELDRYKLSPDRVAIEVLETVIAGPSEGAVSKNVNGLAKLGCYIDLDDFGTGNASINSIRRFSVSRLKIDRSFVMHVDSDPEQQRLVATIVTMAERLGLETLAEGVETAGEHNMLAQLGCNHVQGFGIARPMPFEQTIPWMTDHIAALQQTPQIGKQLR